MEVNILFIILLISGPLYDGDESSLETCLDQTVWTSLTATLSSQKHQIYHLKYLKLTISYYDNSSSTFHLELLVSGDINPNPGPELSNNSSHPDASKSNYSASPSVSYSRSKLFDLRNKAKSPNSTHCLPPDILTHIQNLGILAEKPHHRRTHRGKKAGCRRAKYIPVCAEQRHDPFLQAEMDRYSNPNNFAQFPSSSQNNIKAALWNARSTRNKTLSVYDFVLENNIDILFVTETWLCEDDPVIIGELTPPSYSFLNIPRTQTDLYGGIGILYRSSLKLSIKQTDIKTITFEHAIVTDVLRCVQYIVVYRPPPSAVNGFKTKDYLTEIDEFLSDVNMSANKLWH